MTFIRIAIILLLFPISLVAQSDSCGLRISLLTCSPGAELYSTFGHTAIRVTDNARGVDMVYNYGTFDDRDPNFYVKFTKGLMEYALSNYSYQDFLMEYQSEGRGVIEQVLLLNCAQQQQLYTALQQNALEQNRFYNYYFHTDNCTTRAGDMIAQRSGAHVVFNNILPPEPLTFRNLIHSYLNKGGQYWSKLGIDILLGYNLDEKVNNKQAMFLPDYLMEGVDSAVIAETKQPLVVEKQTVLPVAVVPDASSWFTPFVLFTFLLLLVAVLSFTRKKWSRQVLAIFDCIFFLLLGLLGIIIITLWMIRIDNVCRDNFNLLWALPTHFIVAFVMYKHWRWVQQYFRFVFIFSILVALCWWLIPQQLNTAILPLLGIIIVRSYFRSKLKSGYAGKKYAVQ
jgi:hypothetical protein